ncbi:MAG: polyprenol phosphomannose-dependent alpha 1,6 mannosyltransferase MptB [Chloroflexia bacterium]
MGRAVAPARLVSSASRLFREAYGAPALPLSPNGFRTAHAVVLLAVWGVYALLMRTFSRGGGGRKALVIAATAIIMLAPPVLSTDVYYYGATGWSAYRFGGNPHVQPPESILSSQLLPYVYWTDFPSPYGPVWTALSTAVAGATGDDPFRSAMGFKAAATGSMLLSAWLSTSSRADSRGAAGQAFTLYALNPLVLLETAGAAHNERPCRPAAAAAAWALCRGASALGLVGASSRRSSS